MYLGDRERSSAGFGLSNYVIGKSLLLFLCGQAIVVDFDNERNV
jgi:hypothetical protein